MTKFFIKRLRFVSIGLLLLVSLPIPVLVPLFSPAPVSAHELIPKEVLEYIDKNPQATPQQIEEFAKNGTKDKSAATKSGSELIAAAQNNNSGFFENSFKFIGFGIKHILSGPDHILFVVSLLLVFSGLKKILKLATAFTVAHSLTLILAGSNILTLSSRIVEPIIALSISVLAISTVFFADNKYLKNPRIKIGIVFFFGLFHGLGFAGLLEQVQVPNNKFISSLLSFNIGVEIGQLLIIASVLPFIYFFRNKPWYGMVIKILAVIIGIFGVVWAVQRILS